MKTKEKLTLLQMSSLLRVVTPREAASLKGGDGSGQPATCVFQAMSFAYNHYEVCGPMVDEVLHSDYAYLYGDGTNAALDDAINQGMTGDRAYEFSSNYFNSDLFDTRAELVNFLGTGDTIAMVSINQGSYGHAVIAVGYNFQEYKLRYIDPENQSLGIQETHINNVDLQMMIGLTGCKGYSDPNQ